MSMRERFWDINQSSNQDMPFIWRLRIFNAVFLITAILALFPCTISIMHAVQGGWQAENIIYTISYFLLIGIILIHGISFKIRAWIGVLILYAIWLCISLTIGIAGSRYIYLLSFSIIASLVLGFKAGLITMGMNFIAIITIGWLTSVGCFNWLPQTPDVDKIRFIFAITFLWLNAISTVSLAIFIHKMELGLKKKKQLEVQLQQSQKMEAIGTLAGGIAHDFNNILSGIFGYAQLVEMTLNEPDQARNNLKLLVKGAQRASDLVQQILTFSRQTEHKKNPLKLFIIVKESVKFLRSSIPATIEIQENITSRAMVLADPTEIHQVVINLCTNAYHAMRDSGGILFVALNDVEITPQSHPVAGSVIPGHYLKLEVRDTGHGMDTKIMEKIFNPYFTTHKKGRGTGLGLAIVDRIIKNHNGFIKTDSKVGRGSTFQVFWPVIEQKENYNLSEKKGELPKGTEQIMLVDDETDILDTSQAVLERIGYKVAIFKNGLSALQAFIKRPNFFDLIVTDMTMPGMTGDELSAQVLKLRKDMPIILYTGYHENFTKNMACKIGIRKYAQKPIMPRELPVLIREILDGK